MVAFNLVNSERESISVYAPEGMEVRGRGV